MANLANYLGIIVDVVFGLIILLLLLRFHLSGSMYENTHIHRKISFVTTWLVLPLNKIFRRRIWGMEFMALVAALIISILQEIAIYSLQGYKLFDQLSISAPILTARGTLQVLYVICQIYEVVLIAGVIISWLRLRNPATVMISHFSNQLLYPFRKFIRPIGGIDFSPAVALLALILISVAIRDAIAGLDSIF